MHIIVIVLTPSSTRVFLFQKGANSEVEQYRTTVSVTHKNTKLNNFLVVLRFLTLK